MPVVDRAQLYYRQPHCHNGAVAHKCGWKLPVIIQCPMGSDSRKAWLVLCTNTEIRWLTFCHFVTYKALRSAALVSHSGQW